MSGSSGKRSSRPAGGDSPSGSTSPQGMSAAVPKTDSTALTNVAPSRMNRLTLAALAAGVLSVIAFFVLCQRRGEKPPEPGVGGKQPTGVAATAPDSGTQFEYHLELLAAAGNDSWQHWAPVLGLAITPDERTIISLGADGQLKLWDLATEQARQSLSLELKANEQLATDPAVAMALSADGGVLAVSTSAGTQWWRLPQLQPMAPQEPQKQITGRVLALSPDGRQLLVWRDGLRAYDTATATELFTVHWVGDSQPTAAAAPAGQVASSTPTEVVAQDSRPAKQPATANEAAAPAKEAGTQGNAASPAAAAPKVAAGPNRAVFRNDGRYLALADASRAVVWDLAMLEQAAEIDGGGSIQDIAFGDGDTLLIAGTADVGVWDLPMQQVVRQIQPHRFSGDPQRGRIVLARHAPLIAVIEPEGITLTSSTDGAQVARLTTPAQLHESAPFDSQRQPRLEFSAGGRYVAFDTSSFGIQVWEPSMQRLWPADRAERFAAVAVSYSPDGKRLALFDRAGRIRLVDAATGQTVKDFAPTASGPVALSGDWQTYATVKDGNIVVHKLADGERLRTVELEGSKAEAVALSKESRLLAASLEFVQDGFTHRVVHVWDLETGQRQCEINVSQFPAHRLVFHPDGRRLALLRKDEVLLLDTATGEPVWEEPQQPFFRSRPGGIGQKVAVQTPDPWLRVVDSNSAADLLHATGDHANDVVAAAFSADETLLAGCTDNGRLLLWELPATGKAPKQDMVKVEPSVSLQLGPERGQVFDVAFAPDGSALAVACGDGVTRVLRIVRERRRNAEQQTRPNP